MFNYYASFSAKLTETLIIISLGVVVGGPVDGSVAVGGLVTGGDTVVPIKKEI